MATGYTRQFRFITLVVILTASFRNSYADQDKERVTINEKGISIESAFRKIEAQVSVTFFYLVKDLNGRELIPNLSLNNVTINEAISTILKGKNLSWSIKNDVVYIKRKTLEAIDTQAKSASDTLPKYTISGKVTDRSGSPLPGVTVSLKGQVRGQGTNSEGQFQIANVSHNATITFSSIGFETRHVRITGPETIKIVLDTLIRDIQTVEVVSTGYQTIARQKATGSYELIDNQLYNRRVGFNALDRLEGIAAGVVFNKNTQSRVNESAISIRSRGTIFANPNPMVVVDNFPYQGDFNNINPNDVESITILKDAAAAAIWGALSGNGVIVVTTKKGKNNQPLRVSFNSNITMSGKPDLHYMPRLSSNNFIDYERFLFDNKYYVGQENSLARPLLSPAVEIFIRQRDGEITEAQAQSELAQLGIQDIYDDQSRFFYRTSFSQQYGVSLSGGGRNQNFYLSVNYDRSLEGVKKNDNDRISINAKNSFSLLDGRLQVSLGVNYTQRNSSQAGFGTPGVTYPYTSLGEPDNPSVVFRGFRAGYIDTIGGGRLLDWHYKPLMDFGLSSSNTKNTEYRIDGEAKYKVFNWLQASVGYQFISGSGINKAFNDENSFYVRDAVNRYSQVNYITGEVFRPIPFGGILDRTYSTFQSYNIRGQLSVNHNFGDMHEITGIAGVEQRENRTTRDGRRMYGYNDITETDILVDYFKDYPLLPNGQLGKIVNPFIPSTGYTLNRFRSYFVNGSYRLMQRYSLSGSIRRDESNLFGVKANQKGVPLWSVGGAWEVHNEEFYHLKFMPSLKIRASFGYNGNVDNSLSAYTTASAWGNNSYNAAVLTIQNPPNPSLRWEKTKIVNIGVDFKLFNNRLGGGLEYYKKDGIDLISSSPIDPTTGFSTFTGNTANLTGHGIDITLNAVVIKKAFLWKSTFILSKAVEKVTEYRQKTGAVSVYFAQGLISPVVGYPVYGMFAYRWAGLDPANGDPQVIFNDKISKEYSAIYASTNFNNVRYVGTLKPAYFGSWMNTFSYKKVALSINVSYKLKYYFRSPALKYASLINNPVVYSHDYNSRWKMPGDETRTNVPSRVYPQDPTRDEIYQYSDIHILKGDHVRIQDIRLDYPITIKCRGNNVNLNLYGYINNVGVVWRDNNSNIDPDFVGSLVPPRTYSLGLSLGL